MADKLASDERDAFVGKLERIRRDTARIYPSPANVPGDWGDEADCESLLTVKERLLLIFRRFGFADGVEMVTTIFDESRNHLLWVPDDPPWVQGRYSVVVSILDAIDSYIFAYANDDDAHRIRTIRYRELLELLRNLERAFSITSEYPKDEGAFGLLVNSIVACSFPSLQPRPVIVTTLKSFIPDCGVPEVRTLIEYKYISRQEQVPRKVDEMLADFLGYSGSDWDQIIYTIYETKRFVPEDAWREQFKRVGHLQGHHRAEFVVVKGIPVLS